MEHLNTAKFKKLITQPDEYLTCLAELAKQHGLEVAIKQIKRSGIAVSRNKSGKEMQLFADSCGLLLQLFPKKKRKIKKLKSEAQLLQELYQNIFAQIPKFTDKTLLAKEKAGLLIFLERYLLNTRHFCADIEAIEEGDSEEFSLKKEAEYVAKKSNAIMDQTGFYDEITREMRGVLLYFHSVLKEEIDEIELRCDEIANMKKYISLIEKFWFFEHYYELWVYLDLEIYQRDGRHIYKGYNKKICEAWMVANYRSRERQLAKEAKKDNIEKIGALKKTGDFFTYLCLSYFFALPGEIYLNGISLDKWHMAYENLRKHAKQSIRRATCQMVPACINDIFDIKTRKQWIKIIGGDHLREQDVAIIFLTWVINDSNKKNKGDIFDHPFYEIGRDKYILFNSVASQLEPIMCIRALVKQNDLTFKILRNQCRDPLESEVGLGLEKNNIKYYQNVELRSLQASHHTTNELGEFDVIFKVENTLFFVECKRFMQPFYFKEHQSVHERIYDGCRQLNKSVKSVIHNEVNIFSKDSSLNAIFAENWQKKFKVTKLLVTSCDLGQYMNILGCHVMDIGVFNTWLYNTEYFMRNILTMQRVSVLIPKQTGSLLERFERLKDEIPLIELTKSWCKTIKREVDFDIFKASFPHYAKFQPIDI